jgi:subtilase family serine protease
MELQMQRIGLTFLNAFVLVGFLGGIVPQADGASAVPKRLRSNIDDSRTFQLTGNTRPAVTQGLAQDLGQVSSSLVMPRMSIHFSLTAAQQTDLNQFLTSLQDRRSSNYHKFLTPEEYAARFGVNEADLAKITTWLEDNGFSNLQVARSRGWVSFNGTAGQVQQAFHTAIHRYSLNGEPHFANSSDPLLPKALQGMAMSVRGLHNFHLKGHVQMKPRFTSSLSGDTYLTPDDWATIYDVKPMYSAGLDGSPLSNAGTACGGSPCSIVVVGQSDVLASDLAAFRAAAALPAKTVTTVVPPNDNDPGIQTQSGDEGESDLDLEWANGIAKNANILFVTADFTVNNGVEDSIAYAIDNNVAPILSTSYGLCELYETVSDMSAQNALFQLANAQGMTIVSASGDGGAADCDTGYPANQGLSVDFPASSPYVTGVGGTTLTVANTTTGGYWSSSNNGNSGSAQSYIPEAVWNDTLADAALAASGGGASAFFAKPSWQTGTGVPGNSFRNVPDIAFTASPNQNGLLLCGEGWCTSGFRNASTYLDVTGGTSAGPPNFAGVLAMIVQQTGARLGNINPNIYSLAQISQTAFHDITSGNNIVPCTVGSLNCTTGTMGYSAGIGYDQTTGWGSIDSFNLAEQWSEDIQMTASPTNLTIQAGSSGSSTVTVTPYKNFTGQVTFACTVASALADVTCSLSNSQVNTSGSTTVTINAAGNAHMMWLDRFRHLPPPALGWFLLSMVMASLLFALRNRRATVYAFGSAALLMLVLGAASCGGTSSSGSTGSTGSTAVAESGNVIVTGTSGQIVNTVNIAVSIP